MSKTLTNPTVLFAETELREALITLEVHASIYNQICRSYNLSEISSDKKLTEHYNKYADLLDEAEKHLEIKKKNYREIIGI